MDIFGVLSLIGGLALFLYGMHVMGAGLEKMSGGRLERILENLTSNPLKAVLLGAGVTAVIQSSSATTVMVVGFVNSGIMKLSQAIGIIMGANIGTTITAWLLSLTGIQGDNLFINMLKPTSFSPILAMIGIILLIALSAKNGILIVEFARDYRKVGNPIREAAYEAGHVRLRPILMTSFTFVLGVMPLLFATGAGAGSRVALGAAVVFGMAVNTIFATIYIPNWYEVMQNIQEKWLTKKQ